MEKKRMLEDVKQAKRLTPAWLSPFLAYGLVLVGELLAGLVLGLLLGMLIAPLLLTFSDADAVNMFFNPEYPDLFMFMSLLSFAGIAAMVFLWVYIFEKRPLVTLGFYKKDRWKELFKGWGIGILLFTLVLLILVLCGAYRLESVNFSPYALGFAVLITPFWLLQGGTEELVTRGWLFPVMAAKSNRIIGMVVSSTLFGVLHVFNSGFSLIPFLNLILFGFLMVCYLLKTDNLWGVAGIHAAWNFAQGNLFGILVSGQSAGTSLTRFIPIAQQDWLTGGDFGVEGSLVTSVILLAGIVFLGAQLKKEV